jgi:type I restriction enzyme M protein
MPKDKQGNLLHDKAMNGDDLIAFVDGKLFPYLRKFKEKADSPDTIEYKIGAIFGEMRNKVNSGFTLRDILAIIDKLQFGSRDDKHELSALYEEKIRNMGNAGRNGGEYYTPRPLIRAMINVTDPKIGERVYDGAVGSAGFLCEAYDYMSSANLTTAQKKTLAEKTFYGKEKKPLAYVIAIMNLMLHGVKSPNIVNTNTLAENIQDIQEKDRYEIVLANPPFGGKEREEVQENFPIKTSETASLFLQHFIKILKADGRGAIVIKNTFLSNTDNASVALRKKLLADCDLHTVLDCPGGTFQGAGVKTVVLFFIKGKPTKKIWFYQLDSRSQDGQDQRPQRRRPRGLPEAVEDQGRLAQVLDHQGQRHRPGDLRPVRPQSEHPEEAPLRSPAEILAEIERLDAESAAILKKIKGAAMSPVWPMKRLAEVCQILGGATPSKKNPKFYGGDIPWATVGDMNVEVITTTEESITKAAVDDCSTNVIPAGSIVMATRVGLGKVCVLGQDTAINQDLKGLTPKNAKELSCRWLYWWLKSKASDIQKAGTGATVQGVKMTFVQDLEIPLPPLAEQKRIVALLDKAFAGIERGDGEDGGNTWAY